MLSYSEVNEILKKFDSRLYNKLQIGSNKKIVISIYEFLSKLNLSKEVIEALMRNIAFIKEDSINIPLYLEILSKSLGFINVTTLKELLDVVRDVHDIYYRDDLNITLEEYLHDISDSRMKKLFLDRNGKYLEKNLNSEKYISYINDLYLAGAMVLDKKEYNEFMSYIDEFKKYQGSYSPFKLFRMFIKVRKKLKGKSCLFWDIVYGNEYVLSLCKSDILLTEMYKENIYSLDEMKTNKKFDSQLSLVPYSDVDSNIKIRDDVKCFQLCTLYNSKEVPTFKQEKDLLHYYNKLITKGKKDVIVLPKLKNETSNEYAYDTN